MSENSKIEWTDHTFNPWIGCQKVSPACDHCYAEAMMDTRLHKVQWGPGMKRIHTSDANWKTPVKWNAEHDEFFAQHGRRQRVFCASVADVFDNAIDPEWRSELFELIRITPNLDWLLLTKRPQNIIRMVQESGAVAGNGMRYLPGHVWLGTTVEDQRRADQNIPALLQTIGQLGARMTFLSAEPMLGPVEVFSKLTGELLHTSGDEYNPGFINWVISGGESGAGARWMNSDWPRDLRDQCAVAGVAFHFKQHGEWVDVSVPAFGKSPGEIRYARADGSLWDAPPEDEDADCITICRVGKKAAGRMLDGRTWDEVPHG